MRDQVKSGRAPGRIVNVISSAGLVGNFAQSAITTSPSTSGSETGAASCGADQGRSPVSRRGAESPSR
jgi:hypothetical protein